MHTLTQGSTSNRVRDRRADGPDGLTLSQRVRGRARRAAADYAYQKRA